MNSPQTAPYVVLEEGAKRKVLVGAGLLWFYNLIFSFTMPVVLPTIMATYGMMGFYAVLSGVTSLLLCVATPIGGKLGDRFGRRRICLLAGYLRLAIMLFCAVPTNGALFFAAAVIGNMLGGILSAYPSAILGDVTVPEERPRLFGIFGTINGTALLLGLLCGGAIVDLLGAFSVYLVFAPFGLASMLLLTFYYPNRPAQTPAPVDGAGMVLLTCGFACVLTWCAFGGTLFERFSLPGTVLLIGGLLLIAGLLYVEPRAKDPLLDLRLFRIKPFAMSFGAYFLIAPMMCLCSSLLVLFGQMSLGLPAIISGTLALPKNILFVLVPTALGAWVARDPRRFRVSFLMCGIAVAVASLLASTWSGGTPLAVVYATMLIFGVGSCFQAVSIQPYMQIAVGPGDIGVASAMVLFANSVGVAMFNAFYNIFYNARYAAMMAGDGHGLAGVITGTFSATSRLSAVCGVLLIVLALILIPRKKGAPTIS